MTVKVGGGHPKPAEPTRPGFTPRERTPLPQGPQRELGPARTV